jgi:hypothetical protein
MEQIASWVAPIATMVATMMTAMNLGSRITGWGFILFTIGSIAWSIVAIHSGQQNLLLTNVFLTVVNAVGIWRWLGRQARYDDGGAIAAERSAQVSHLPTLFAIGSVAGTKLVDHDDTQIGVVIEGMMRCTDSSLSYIVVSEGGMAGVGERLHALAPDQIHFADGKASCDLTAEQLADLPVIASDKWPATLEHAADVARDARS